MKVFKFFKIFLIIFLKKILPELRDNRPPLSQYKIALIISFFIIIILSAISLVAIFGSDSLETPQSSIKIISREGWNATKAKTKLEDFKLSINRFIIAHTATRECYNKTECIKIIKEIQRKQMEPPQNFDDIEFNFLIGGDGNIYEGFLLEKKSFTKKTKKFHF